MSGQILIKLFKRLLWGERLDPVSYWRQRAFQGGNVSVMWANSTYNELADRDQWEAIARHLPTARASVLDVGCGTGRLSARLAARFAEYVGVDFDTMIAEARRRNPALAACFVESSVHDYDFGKNRFDLILSMGCLSTACSRDELPQILLRVFEAIRPGGRCIMIDPFHRSNLLARTCKMSARQVIKIARESKVVLEYWSGLHCFPCRMLLTELAWFRRRPGVTRWGYYWGERLLRIAPRWLSDYSIVVLQKR
jgi:2-polyprenyl-3-methyl-5-hydroxy-6-metoxy-1,4-benzoquinol methylase